MTKPRAADDFEAIRKAQLEIKREETPDPVVLQVLTTLGLPEPAEDCGCPVNATRLSGCRRNDDPSFGIPCRWVTGARPNDEEIRADIERGKALTTWPPSPSPEETAAAEEYFAQEPETPVFVDGPGVKDDFQSNIARYQVNSYHRKKLRGRNSHHPLE